jgi:lipoic acid synthetase
MRKPEWFKTNSQRNASFHEVGSLVKDLSLHTVCEEANCPNRTECYSHHTATFMILGSHCTRNCTFCNVTKGSPEPVMVDEPENIAKAVTILKLKHAVITSVTRDDLPDSGSSQFVKVIQAIRELCPSVTIEVLIPDMKGDWAQLAKIVKAKPDILNHNVETIERLYPQVRPMASYHRSLGLIQETKKLDPTLYTKSGFMLGLGESRIEVIQLMKDLLNSNCDIVTIGQYLPPSKNHYPLQAYITPEEFKEYKTIGLEMGFKQIVSSPLTRSSYHADEFLAKP